MNTTTHLIYALVFLLQGATTVAMVHGIFGKQYHFAPLLSMVSLFGCLSPLPCLFAFCALAVASGCIRGVPELLLLWVLLGVNCGCSLTLLAHCVSRAITRPMLKAINAVRGFIPYFVDEQWLSRWFGVVGSALYTTITELAIVPVAVVIMSITALVNRYGMQYDVQHQHRRSVSGTTSTDTLVVLLHGNEFNECQWLYGRVILESMLHEPVHYKAVNIFKGPLMRDHHRDTQTLRDCSVQALQQVCDFVRSHQLKPSRVVIMGHSLGGLIAAHIAEELLDAQGRCVQDPDAVPLPVTNVVLMSAPLDGSDLLEFGISNVHALLPGLGTGIQVEFRKGAQRGLLSKMESSIRLGRISYSGVTGGADPLVRPSSALPTFLTRKLILPHLGHYNIKVSLQFWDFVLACIQVK